MRRLTEILAFPKAWYRRSIVRRMFLGDLSLSATYNDDDDTVLMNSSSSGTTSKSHEARSSKGGGTVEKSPLLTNKDRLKINLEGETKRLKEFKRGISFDSVPSESTSPEHKNKTAWETLVLFAINFKKLNVHMNMGNVMGNVS